MHTWPPMIDGVRLTPLRIIGDERGSVMHMLRATDAHFAGFGEVYFSTVVGASPPMAPPGMLPSKSPKPPPGRVGPSWSPDWT